MTNYLYIQQSLQEAHDVLTKFMGQSSNLDKIRQATELLSFSLKNGGKILSCGNGGSMCDAMHFSEELTGRYRKDRRALAALSLSEPAHLSCVANDFGYQNVFARYVEALGKPGDVLLAISTSGQSKNILLACEIAKKCNMKILALTGKDGGALKNLADISLIVESSATDRIQEIHIKIIHLFIEGIERSLFPEHYV